MLKFKVVPQLCATIPPQIEQKVKRKKKISLRYTTDQPTQLLRQKQPISIPTITKRGEHVCADATPFPNVPVPCRSVNEPVYCLAWRRTVGLGSLGKKARDERSRFPHFVCIGKANSARWTVFSNKQRRPPEVCSRVDEKIIKYAEIYI